MGPGQADNTVWAHQHNCIELYGTEGSIIIPDPNHFGGEVRLAKADGKFHPLGIINQDTRANYRSAGLADMAHAILENQEDRCSIDRALHGVDVLTSIVVDNKQLFYS